MRREGSFPILSFQDTKVAYLCLERTQDPKITYSCLERIQDTNIVLFMS